MEKNTQLPAVLSEEIKKKITKEANAYATERVGDIQTIPANKVNEWEKAADGWEDGATGYAIKLHQVEQENAELRRQNEKMKAQATGWRPLLEEVLSESNELPLTIELIIKIKTFLYGE